MLQEERDGQGQGVEVRHLCVDVRVCVCVNY